MEGPVLTLDRPELARSATVDRDSRQCVLSPRFLPFANVGCPAAKNTVERRVQRESTSRISSYSQGLCHYPCALHVDAFTHEGD
jgi:hypothetical protein